MKFRYMIIFIFFNAIVLSAEELDSLEQILYSPKEKDTLEFRYHFLPSDTMIYTAVGFDSIMIDWGKTLLRTRFETYRLVCDSVKEGRYYLSQTLIDFTAKESTAEKENVERKESNWLNRTVWFEVDSVGRRYTLGADNDSLAGQSIGGAFNPRLIFSFGSSSKAIDESWQEKETVDWIENGIPVPLVRESKLFLLKGIVDTLGYSTTEMTYISTGQGSIKLPIMDKLLSITNIMTGSGELYISNRYNIPVIVFTTYEQKLTIHKPDGTKTPGMHYSNVVYYLDKFMSKRLEQIEE